MPASPIVARISKSDYRRTLIAFRSALALAQLGRADEARTAYADGIKHHGLSPTPKELRDLGGGYQRWYLAEAHRREAEQVLKAKGIAVPARERMFRKLRLHCSKGEERPGDGLGNGGRGGVPGALELEALGQDADVQGASLVGADQHAARRRQALVGLVGRQGREVLYRRGVDRRSPLRFTR
jgi:hypothetical protein